MQWMSNVKSWIGEWAKRRRPPTLDARRKCRRLFFRPLIEMLEGRITPSTFFVDQNHINCSDSGSGSQNNPFCSINAAAAVVQAGDTVQVFSGTYNESIDIDASGTPNSPIVFMVAPGENVTVAGGSYGFEIRNESWITVQGFTITNTSEDGIYVRDSSNITITGNDTSFAGLPQSGQIARGIYLNNTVDSTVSNNVTHHNTDAGIFLTNGSTNVQIAGNVSYENARGYTRAAAGIELRSGGNTVAGNIVYDNEDSGINVISSSSSPNEAANNLIVNNLSYNNGDHGIDSLRSGSQRIIGNTVYNNVTSGINVEGGSSNTTIVNNISVDNAINSPRGVGNIRVDSGSTPGTVVDYNIVYFGSSGSGQVQYHWDSTKYTSQASFINATGQEGHGLEADPLFVDVGNGDFHLVPGSIAIDSANSGVSGQDTVDLDGVARIDDPSTTNSGAGPRDYDDRGAYEYQPTDAVFINGQVFQDDNGDGVKDMGDGSLSDRTVFLDANNNGVLDGGETATTTDVGGFYSFMDLDPGTYRVRQVTPASWTQTTANPTDIVVTEGSNVSDIDFGNFEKFSITGTAFEDNDGNGVRNGGEQGLSGQTVFLDDNNNGTVDGGESFTTTNGQGVYSFANLGPGSYRVRQIGQAGWTVTQPIDVTGSSGANVFGHDSANFDNIAISGHVFEDVNGNGILDAGDNGLVDETVFLDANNNSILDAGELAVTTNGNGDYTFADLGPGTYLVRIAIPAGSSRTTSLPADVNANSGVDVSGQLFGVTEADLTSFLFVDPSHPSASDGGSGTADQPFVTISAAALVVSPGETVLVSAGTYNEQINISTSGTEQAPIIFQAAESASVIVTGGSNGFRISSQSWIAIHGFTITGTSSYGVRVQNSSHISIDGNDVSFAGLPQQGKTSKGIYLSNVTDSRVSYNSVHDNTDSGIYLTKNTTNVEVVGNTSFHNARQYTSGARGIEIRADGNAIARNVVYGNEDDGIYLSGAANSLVLNNVVYNNGEVGVNVDASINNRVIGNTVYGNGAAGINIEDGSTGATIANNILMDNGIGESSKQGNIRVAADSIAGTTLDHDLFFMSAAGEVMIEWAGVDYFSLADFAAATGMESSGLESDPLFADAANGDFHLQADSAAIDSADSSVSDQSNIDADGVARLDDGATPNSGTGPRDYDDRGAYEFAPPGTPANPPGLDDFFASLV